MRLRPYRGKSLAPAGNRRLKLFQWLLKSIAVIDFSVESKAVVSSKRTYWMKITRVTCHLYASQCLHLAKVWQGRGAALLATGPQLQCMLVPRKNSPSKLIRSMSLLLCQRSSCAEHAKPNVRLLGAYRIMHRGTSGLVAAGVGCFQVVVRAMQLLRDVGPP